MKKRILSKKYRNRIIIIVALTFLVLAACYTVFIAPLLEKEEWIYKETTVEKGTLTVGVTESGILEYGITSVLYDLDLDVSDEDEEEGSQKYLEIEEIYARAGQRVAEGDALVKFTEDSVSAVRRVLENALIEAKADYNEAEAEYNLSILEAETDYEGDRIAGQYAASVYNTAKTAVNNNITAMALQIRQYSANTESLEEIVQEAQEDYNEALAAYNEAQGYYTQVEPDTSVGFTYYQELYLNAYTTYQNAKTALEQAKQKLEDNAAQIQELQRELADASARKSIDKLDVEENYQEAVISGDNAEITYRAKLESLKEELSEAEESRKELEEKLAAFERFVGEEGVIYAESSGIVTESAYEPKDTLTRMGVLIAYAAPGDMTISVDVAQEDVVDLSVGDKVEIEFTAYEGEIYQGSILSIDTTATSEDSATVSYRVVIGVEGDTVMLYGGMAADVTFVTEQKEDVLYVSKKAIVEKNGKTYVYQDNFVGGKELVQVETGLSNGSSVEILSGLEEGDTVYIASKVSSETEVKSSGEEMKSYNGSNDFEMEQPEGFDFENMEMPGGSSSGRPEGGFGGRGGNR